MYWYPYDPASRVAISPAVRRIQRSKPTLPSFRADTVAGDRTPRRVRAAFCSGDSPRSSAAQRGDVMSPRRRGAGTRDAVPARVPASRRSPRVSRSPGSWPPSRRWRARPRPRPRPARPRPARPRPARRGCPRRAALRALVHVDDMDAEVVPDARDETGDGDLHARDVTLQKTKRRDTPGARGERRRARGYRREAVRNAAFVRHRRHTRYTRCLEE